VCGLKLLVYAALSPIVCGLKLQVRGRSEDTAVEWQWRSAAGAAVQEESEQSTRRRGDGGGLWLMKAQGKQEGGFVGAAGGEVRRGSTSWPSPNMYTYENTHEMGRANSKKTKSSTVVEAASGLEGIKKRFGARRAPSQPQHEWLSPQFNSALPTVPETTHSDADADVEETVAKTSGAIGSVGTLSLARAPQSVADASPAAAEAAAVAAAQAAAATRVAAGAGVVALSSPAHAAAAPSSLPPLPPASPLKEAMLKVVA
jgi:hypothetical protein